MKIINTATNETVARILTNRSMTLDEAIEAAGAKSTRNTRTPTSRSGNTGTFTKTLKWNTDRKENHHEDRQ